MGFREWIICCALALAGCSPLRTDVPSGFDWTALGPVALEATTTDRGLLPAVEDELRKSGVAVLTDPSTPAGTRAVFSVTEARDINEAGETVSRPKVLHLRFLDREGHLIAAGTYHLSPSENPKWGVRALVSGLRQAKGGGFPQASAAAPPPPGAARQPVAESAPREKTPLPAEPAAGSGSAPWAPRLESWGVESWGKEGTRRE